MAIRNLHWYSRNEGIAYPVDAAAASVTDSGARLPANIVIDLNLRWPDSLGRYAFLSSVTVTPLVVSITIQSATSLDSGGLSPLAVLTLTRPVTAGIQYALLAQAPGVGGWIVFGSGVEDKPFRGTFSTAAQSFFTSRAARGYRPLPVSGIGLLNAVQPLGGIVRLSVTDPLRIAVEDRDVDGALRNCIVVSLADDSDQYPIPPQAVRISGYQAPTVFEQFSGPCAGRPESQTCGDPQPIQFLNSVGPDCTGNITLQFQGCAFLTRITSTCGAVLDCNLGLTDACLPPLIPDSDGVLPDEYTPVNYPAPEPGSESAVSEALSESIIDVEFPFTACFPLTAFITNSGSWENADDNDPYGPCDGDLVLASQTASTPCVATWSEFDLGTLGRTVTTDIQLLQGPAGANHNAYLVLNYRPSTTQSGQSIYFTATIDYDYQRVQISWFNGSVFQPFAQTVLPGVIQLSTWYRIVANIAVIGGQVGVTATFTSLADSSLNVTIGPALLNGFLPATGSFGVGTNNAISEFSFLGVAQYNG